MFIKFTELPVDDQDRAIAFYIDKLGWQLAKDAPYEDDWRWVELQPPGAETRMLLTRRSAAPGSDSPRLVLVVSDVESTHHLLEQRDIHFTRPPQAAPWSPDDTYACFSDSEGNEVVIISELPLPSQEASEEAE